MPVMSPGIRSPLLGRDSRPFLYCLLFISAVVIKGGQGRPSRYAPDYKYPVPLVQPYYLFYYTPQQPVPDQSYYYSQSSGFGSQYLGPPVYPLQAPYNVPYNEGFIHVQPLHQHSFRQVETRSLPEELISLESIQYSSPKQSLIPNGDGPRKPIRKSKGRPYASEPGNPVETSMPKVLVSRNRVILPKPKADNKKPSEPDTSKYIEDQEPPPVKSSVEYYAPESNYEDPIEAELTDSEQTDDLGKPSNQILKLRVPSSKPPTVLKSKPANKTAPARPRTRKKVSGRHKRFFLILSSILNHNKGRLGPTPKVSRQATNSESRKEPPTIAPPNNETVDEMMEFGDTTDSDGPLAVKMGMNMISVRLAQMALPVPTVPTTVSTTRVPSLLPAGIDYEVPDYGSESFNDLPPLPFFESSTTIAPASKAHMVSQADPKAELKSPNSSGAEDYQDSPNDLPQFSSVTKADTKLSSESSESSDSQPNNGTNPDEFELEADPTNAQAPITNASSSESEFEFAAGPTNAQAPVVNASSSESEFDQRDSPPVSSVNSVEFEGSSESPVEEVTIENANGQTQNAPNLTPSGLLDTRPEGRFGSIDSDLPPLPGSLFPGEDGEQEVPEPMANVQIMSTSSPTTTMTTEEPYPSDLPPLPDISLFPNSPEQDVPIRPLSTTTTTTESPITDFPVSSGNLPPFPVQDDYRQPELPYPSPPPEPEEPELPFPDLPPGLPEPVTAAPEPPIPPTTTQPNSSQYPQLTGGGNDWLREVALKALDRGIAIQQIYSLNVGHIVLTSAGSLAELKAITTKPLGDLLRDHLIPVVNSLVSTSRPVAKPENGSGLVQGTPTGQVDLGTGFAPVTLGTRTGPDKGIPQAERSQLREGNPGPPMPIPARAVVGELITERPILTPELNLNQLELPSQILPESPGSGTGQSAPEKSPRVKQNIDPRSISLRSQEVTFPEDSKTRLDGLDFRAALVELMKARRRQSRSRAG